MLCRGLGQPALFLQHKNVIKTWADTASAAALLQHSKQMMLKPLTFQRCAMKEGKETYAWFDIMPGLW